MQANSAELKAVESAVTPEQAMLHKLLDLNLGLPTEYRDGLTNHLPMALQALHAMGAGTQRMLEFHTGYARRFEGRSSGPRRAPPEDWRALRGVGARDPDAFQALVAGFEQALAREGEAAVLRRVLPDLLPGVAAAAFHGVIRTAHAVQSGHRGELAHGLAYWAWQWQELAPAQHPATPLDFEVWARRLVDEAPAERVAAPLISLRMGLATATPTYLALGAAQRPMPDLLRRLAGLALERYLASRSFTVLHMITGLRALRVLLRWVDDVQALQPVLVRAFVAAYLAGQVKPLAERAARGRPDWAEVTAAAIASDDDHVVKLVHACREEYAAWGDARYLDAAALAVS